MSGFVRPADWLRHLFTSSRTAPVNPVEVSDDVSLNQPYDGGGFPLWDPGQWISTVTSVAVAAGETTLLTVPDNQIARILGVSAQLSAGVAPTVHLRVISQSNARVGLSPLVLMLASARRQSIELQTPIIGPGHLLSGAHFGGDVLTKVAWAVYFVQAPIGTVFYV